MWRIENGKSGISGTNSFSIIHSSSSKDTEYELSKQYKFTVTRYKNSYTNEEFLKIYVTHNSEKCAEITTNLVDLSRDIFNLRKYGVVLLRKSFNEICREIEKNYLTLVPNIIQQDLTKTTCDIYKYYAFEIKQSNIELVNGLYNIPVTEFKKYINEYYGQYKYADIRKKLSELTVSDITANEGLNGFNDNIKKVTKCSYGRTDNTVNGKKVISFVADIVNILYKEFNYEGE